MFIIPGFGLSKASPNAHMTIQSEVQHVQFMNSSYLFMLFEGGLTLVINTHFICFAFCLTSEYTDIHTIVSHQQQPFV